MKICAPITCFNSSMLIDLYFFQRGPDDNSKGIETCRPRSINNILFDCCVWLNIVVYCIEQFGMEIIKKNKPTNNAESWLHVHGMTLLRLECCTKNNPSKFRPRIHETIRDLGGHSLESLHFLIFNFSLNQQKLQLQASRNEILAIARILPPFMETDCICNRT